MASKQVDFDLYKAGVIADLTIPRWGAKTKLTKEDLGLREYNAELIRLGGKRLIPKDKMAKISSAVALARGYLRNNSFPFPFGNVVFIPYARLQKVLSKIAECKKSFNEGVEELSSEYSEIRNMMIKDYDKAFESILKQRNGLSATSIVAEKQKLLERLEDKYPTLSELKKKFGFEFVLFEIKEPDFESLSSEKALDNARIAHEVEETYKKMVEQKLDTFLGEVVDKLKTMVLDIVSKLKYRIEKETISMASISSGVR